MRSTRATSAIERLKERTGQRLYTMARTGDELFFLTEGPGCAPARRGTRRLCAFVNGLGPQKACRVSKLDVAFEKQLTKKPQD